jgi:type IV pilus assembly protein PilM
MASPRSAWGIDIGNRALKAVKLVRDGDAIRVDDFDFIEHETILSQAGDNRDDLIRHALQTFVGRKSTKNAAVAVGVSGQTSFARFIKLPPVEPKQIPQIVRFEAIQQIPFPLDEVEWAYQLFQSPESPDIECGIFAMRKELVNTWVNQFTANDLNVQAVQMNPLAVYNAVQRDGRLADGTAMIIDVGAENTDLIIAGENSIWMRSIPIGGNSFTETIMKAFKLPMNKAEELKRDAAGSKYYRQILQAMRPVFADLVAEIQRSIGFYGSVNRENKINKIIALGGTFRMPSLPKYLQQNLSLDVERPDNFMAALPEDSKMAASLTENVLSLHAAYGLALQAMGETKVDSSLLPTAIRKRKMWQEKNKWFATAAALCVGGLVVAGASYLINSQAFAAREADFQKAEQVKNEFEGLSNTWKNEVQSAGAAELQTIKNVSDLLNNRELWPNIASDIAMALPQPPASLAAAIAAGDVETIRQTAREARPILQIDTLYSTYYNDLAPLMQARELRTFVGTPGAGGMVPMSSGFAPMPTEFGGAPAAEGGGTAGPRGFLVYAKLVSPHRQADSELVSEVFLKNLAALAPTAATPNRSYAFVRPEFIKATMLINDRDLVERIRADYAAMQSAKTQISPAPAAQPGGMGPGGMMPGNEGMPFDVGPVGGGPPGGFPGGGFPGGGFPGGGFPGGGLPTGGAESADALKDRLTGEDLSRDRVLEVVFLVVLDPPAFSTTPVEPGAEPAAPAEVPVPTGAPAGPPAGGMMPAGPPGGVMPAIP